MFLAANASGRCTPAQVVRRQLRRVFLRMSLGPASPHESMGDTFSFGCDAHTQVGGRVVFVIGRHIPRAPAHQSEYTRSTPHTETLCFLSTRWILVVAQLHVQLL